MYLPGSLLKEMQAVIADLTVLIIDEIVSSSDGSEQMYNDDDRWNYGPVNDVTAAQQKVIMLAQTYNRPIVLLHFEPWIPVGLPTNPHHIATLQIKTKPSLRTLLPTTTPIVNKHNPNAFLSTGLDDILTQTYRNPNVKNLVVMGWHGNICVPATIGLPANTVSCHTKGNGAIQNNFTVLTSQAVLNGFAGWSKEEDSRIKFYREL